MAWKVEKWLYDPFDYDINRQEKKVVLCDTFFLWKMPLRTSEQKGMSEYSSLKRKQIKVILLK